MYTIILITIAIMLLSTSLYWRLLLSATTSKSFIKREFLPIFVAIPGCWMMFILGLKFPGIEIAGITLYMGSPFIIMSSTFKDAIKYHKSKLYDQCKLS